MISSYKLLLASLFSAIIIIISFYIGNYNAEQAVCDTTWIPCGAATVPFILIPFTGWLLTISIMYFTLQAITSPRTLSVMFLSNISVLWFEYISSIIIANNNIDTTPSYIPFLL